MRKLLKAACFFLLAFAIVPWVSAQNYAIGAEQAGVTALQRGLVHL